MDLDEKLIVMGEFMDQVIVDSQTVKVLGGFTAPTILRDPSGFVLGFFHPSLPVPRDYFDDPGISEEELARRGREGGSRTTAEILADLESRK